MLNKTQLSTILLIAAVIWGLLLIVSGVVVSISWLKLLSTVSGIMLILLGIFDRWAWRFPLLQGWLVKRPIIFGTWQTTVHSNWQDPRSGEKIASVPGYMVIKQTYSSLHMRLITAESSSVLVGAGLTTLPDKTINLSAVYRNEPRHSVRQDSPIHYGALYLQLEGKPVTRIYGQYWTDRNTAGEIELFNRKTEIFYDYESARNAFEE